jgi:hypothetical protein
MSPQLAVADCPECRGPGTVFFGVCDVCFAEFLEDDGFGSGSELGLLGPTSETHGAGA